LVAAVAALLLPAVLWLTGVELPYAPALQVALFVALGCALLPRPIAARLSSRAHRDRKARRLAREMFFSLGLAHTRGRTGVLLFASVAEHYVEVVADRAIHDLAQDIAWQAVIARFTASVRAGRLADGYVAALEELGAILARHAPRAPDDTNEIPDRLIEIG
jgi:putative membrane protein